jgi:hypothetical protein
MESARTYLKGRIFSSARAPSISTANWGLVFGAGHNIGVDGKGPDFQAMNDNRFLRDTLGYNLFLISFISQ